VTRRVPSGMIPWRVTHWRASRGRCRSRPARHMDTFTTVFVTEIADYEVRRELLRADRPVGLARLNALKTTLPSLPLTTPIMLRAAELWAEARRRGRPTADPQALDCDVILAAQALAMGATVVTDNVGHLSLFVEAKSWRDIPVAEDTL
jgi:predicted nucleic acid-binding protein